MSKGAGLALTVTLLLACQGGAARDRSAGDAGTARPGPRTRVLDTGDRVATPRSSAPLPRETGFTLLDAGAEPRAPRRYTLAAAAERTLTAELAITSRTLRDGVWTEPVTLPAITQPLAVRPEPSPARLRLRANAATIADGGSDAARRAAEAQTARWRSLLERRRVDASVDDRGRIAALEFADRPGEPGAPSPTPAPAHDELWQYLLGLAVPLPDEPIGVGARWKVTTLLRAGTTTVTQTAEYRLAAVDGDRWIVELTARRIGERQQVEAGIELIGLLREVTGTVTLTPADPLPVSGSLQVEVRSHARIAGAPIVEVASEDLAAVTLK